MQLIKSETIQDITYYTTQYRGIEYFCYKTKNGEEWCVHSRRLALGKHNVGSYRHYRNIQLLAKNIKAFNALPELISMKETTFH